MNPTPWLLAGALLATGPGPAAAGPRHPVDIRVLAPEKGHHVGLGGRGWFVDLEIEFRHTTLEQTGFTDFQLTGPGGHNDIPPMPGTFGPGQDDRLPGLIVLVSTAEAGSCTNLANLFNLTGVTGLDDDEVELWDTWIVGAPKFGVGVRSTLYVAMAADRDGNGIFDDAPDVLPDVDGDGDCDKVDLRAWGLASKVRRVRFHINGE